MTSSGPDDFRLASLRATYDLPALGAGFLKNGTFTGRIDGVRKYRDTTPATLDDSFHLGSDTKAMTATLVAVFIERSRLKWTSTLGQLFGNAINKVDSHFLSVTIEMLLAHRSGISADMLTIDGGAFWKKLWNKSLSPIEGRKLVAETMLAGAPSSAPGSKFEYSNANYIIAGHILEKLSGRSWEDLMHDEIFEPLKMSSSGFGAAGDPEAKVPDQPWGHGMSADHLPTPVKPNFEGDNPPTLGPAGGVHSSMKDWSTFLQLHLDGENGKPTPLLKSSSFKKLHESFPGQEYTCGGWIRVDRPWADGMVLTHDGSNTLNYVTAWLAPKKNLAFFAVTNIGGDGAQKGTHEAVTQMIKANFPRPDPL